MVNKGLLVKVLTAILALFGTFGAMAYFSGFKDPSDWYTEYPKTIFDDIFNKDDPAEPINPANGGFNLGPLAPEILDEKVEGSCGAFIWWYDNEKNEDNVFFYRRIVGMANFTPIKVTGPHVGGPGSFADANLPIGVYEYKVSVVNELGEAFSNVSNPIEISEEVCGNEPLAPKPLNPIIISVVRDPSDLCSFQINFKDNSDNEDGVRIYRWSWVDNMAVIAELGPNNAPTGSYLDTGLPPGHYQYQVSVFNENGESFSQPSEEVEIVDGPCSANAPQSVVSSTSTPLGSAGPAPEACVWTAALNVFIRKGPSSSLYPELDAVVAGTSFPVVGQSENGQFWALEVKPGVIGYVGKAERFGTTSGNCNPPTLQDPPAPVTEPTPSGGSSVPACRDGLDNDGDGAIDMRDRDCSNPDDTSE